MKRPRHTLFLISLLLMILLVILFLYKKDTRSRRLPFNIYPHDKKAFTQGLVYNEGYLYESTGLYGKSTLRKVDPKTGKIIKLKSIPSSLFAEGLTLVGKQLYQLTWKSGKGFIYNKDTFETEGEFTYWSEGWGLTTDGRYLIMGDGTENLYFLDPSNFKVLKTVPVKHRGNPLKHINELEYIEGKIYANIWRTYYIAVINPSNGTVERLIDLRKIIPQKLLDETKGVPNGIAYNKDKGSIYITGKNWPYLFEIDFKEFLTQD